MNGQERIHQLKKVKRQFTEAEKALSPVRKRYVNQSRRFTEISRELVEVREKLKRTRKKKKITSLERKKLSLLKKGRVFKEKKVASISLIRERVLSTIWPLIIEQADLERKIAKPPVPKAKKRRMSHEERRRFLESDVLPLIPIVMETPKIKAPKAAKQIVYPKPRGEAFT